MGKNMLAIVMLAAFSGLATGCSDEEESAGIGQLRMYLINTPASCDSVVLVVKEVSVYSEYQGWIAVNNSIRTFALLQPANGARLMLGETPLEAGGYTRVRLLLDTGSHAIVAGTHRPIRIPEGLEVDTKLVPLFQVNANTLYELYVDFNPGGSMCKCECCKQFKPALHVAGYPEALRNNAERRMKASRGADRCKCGDRWDHRNQSSQHCRHCAPINRSVGAIG